MADDTERWDEDTKDSWREFLVKFEAEILPIFTSYGFDRNTALTAWINNRTQGTIESIVDQLAKLTEAIENKW
jgi:hypothetical protein